jgi:hypothetical protein
MGSSTRIQYGKHIFSQKILLTQNFFSNRRFSFLTRTDSVISSSDCIEMLTNTETESETSSISTAVSNEESPTASMFILLGLINVTFRYVAGSRQSKIGTIRANASKGR